MMRKALLPLVLFALIAAPARAGLQIDVALTGASPIGEYATGESASDIFDPGGGVLADVLFGLSPNLFLGAQVGVYASSGEFFDLDSGDIGEVSLTHIPLHALLQFRSASEASLGFFGQLGLGFTSQSLDVDTSFSSDSLSDTNFSFLIGGGLSYAVSENWALTGGVNFHQTMTPDECQNDGTDLFCDDDNPKFLLFTFGARYSRD